MVRTRRRSWRSSFASDVTAAASSDRAADRPGGTVARQMRVRANAYPLPPAEARLAGTRPVVARSSCHTNTARSVAAPAAARERGTFARASGEVGFHPSGAVAGVTAPGHARRVPGSLPPGGQARTPDRIPSRPRRPRQARPARPPHNAPGTSRASLHHRFCRGLRHWARPAMGAKPTTKNPEAAPTPRSLRRSSRRGSPGGSARRYAIDDFDPRTRVGTDEQQHR
jgi:hypothetical protein